MVVFIVNLLSIPLLVLLMLWISTVIFIIIDSKVRGFITCRKFKKLFDSIEWKIPHYDDDYDVLVNKDSADNDYERIYYMHVYSRQYIYEGKNMIPLTPFDEIMMNRYIRKKLKELGADKKNKKLFMW